MIWAIYYNNTQIGPAIPEQDVLDTYKRYSRYFRNLDLRIIHHSEALLKVVGG